MRDRLQAAGADDVAVPGRRLGENALALSPSSRTSEATMGVSCTEFGPFSTSQPPSRSVASMPPTWPERSNSRTSWPRRVKR